MAGVEYLPGMNGGAVMLVEVLNATVKAATDIRFGDVVTALGDALPHPLDSHVGLWQLQEDQLDLVDNRLPLTDHSQIRPPGQSRLYGKVLARGHHLPDVFEHQS